MSEQDVNQQVAERICSASRWNGTDFRRGDAVALLDGKVVAVAADLDHALQALRALAPDPLRGMILEVTTLASDVVR